MSYASDLGILVGSKVRVVDPSKKYGSYSDGDILELKRDDCSRTPVFRNLTTGSDNCCFTIQDRTDSVTWEHYKEEESRTKIKFPCCVPTSEIKDEETFKKILNLFVSNGATVGEGDYDWGINDFHYYGVDSNGYTKFWDWKSTYGVSEGEVTSPSVVELLGLVPKEEAPVTPVITLFPVGTEVQIAKDSERYYGNEFSSNPKDVKGTIASNTHSHDTDGFVYYVEWSNGSTNSYKLKDLVLWNEGWIEWNGGEIPPVAEGTVVDVKFRDWEEDTDISHVYSWIHDREDSDIIAYRIHKPSIASQEAITERLGDSPSVGIDYSAMGSTASPETLITITQEVKYTVVIKGTTFTFTQEDLDALAEELLGFTTL